MKRNHLIITCIIMLLSPTLFASHYKIDYSKFEYTLNDDLTYTLTVTQKITALTSFGTQSIQKQPVTYYPDAESVKILNAYCIKQDGTKVPVDPAQIFTRTATNMPSAPGFDARMTTTVVYPSLAVNDSTFLHYQLTRKKPEPSGFTTISSPPLGEVARKQEVVISAPKDLYLRWTQHGDYQVTDQIRGDRRWIRASIENIPEIFEEPSMANLGQNLPYFLASTIKSWDDLAVCFWKGFEHNIEPSPSIKALAEQITQNKQGEAAARAIHNWIAQNIHYIAVYLDEASGFAPHSADTILKNGYGDCKDHAAIMIAMLKAVGIEAYPTLISASHDYFSYPLPNGAQFNHVIVYIPSLKLYTDPTNEFGGFGNLTEIEANKFVLIGTPTPKSEHTAQSCPQNSTYSCTKKITIEACGDVVGESIIKVTGRALSSMRRLFSSSVNSQLAKETLMNSEGGEGTIETSDPHDLDRDMFITANWKSPQVVDTDSDESFFSIPVGIDFKDLNSLRTLIQMEQRKFPTVVGAGHLHWDTVITLPQNFKVQHLPKNRHRVNESGEYSSEYATRNGKLYISRDFVIKKDVFAPEEYPDLRTLFYESVRDARSVVGIKKA